MRRRNGPTKRASRPARAVSAVLVSAVLVSAVLLGTGGCAASRDPGSSHSASPQQLQTLMDRWRARAQLPAVVLGVDDGDGRAWVGASGTPQLGGETAVSPDAPFRIASITKVFVAVVVLQLVEEGRLVVDDRLAEYLPDSRYGHVTVRQLLNHTSGIPDYSQASGFGAELLEHRDRRWTPADVLGLVADAEPQFPAGTDYQYSNTDYVLLGEVVTAVTGQSWARQVRDRILDPIGLLDTHVAGVEPVPEPVVAGYFDADNDGDVENVENGRPWTSLETSEGPAGAIVSTAADLLTFGDALFRGELVRDSTVAAMVAEGPFHPRNSNYGLGLEIARPDYRTTIWGHGGFLPGFRSVLWYVPSRDAVIVVLANDTRAVPTDLAELAMRALPARADEP